jgi:hypothetical protein
MAKVVLQNVRLSFPDLFEPVQYQGKGAFRYNASFLVEPGSDNDKKIRTAIKEAATEAYGAKAAIQLKGMENNSNKYCYMDGNLKEYDGYADMMCLSAHRNQTQGAPAVVDRNKDVKLTAADGKPYAGCYVNASVEIYAQKGENPGIRASLIAVQFRADGDAFAGARASADDFEDLSEGAESEEFSSMV